MKKNKKKAFRPGKLIIASGLLAFLILLTTQKVQAETNDSPYLIKVNRYYNTITIYAQDDTGEYNEPVKAITCSVGRKGTETIVGTFKTKEKYRWKLLMGDVWGQYSTRIVGGILFHSVYYYGKCNPATLAVNQYNKLGTAASHGCIRLSVQDAKWIYDNCPAGTTVIIYDDKSSPGPLGKPDTEKLPTTVRWDPTDPNDKNPYKNKKPSIKGVKSLNAPWGMNINLLAGVKAKSSFGADITSKLAVEGSYNFNKAGEYQITYTVTDALGKTSKKETKLTVEESPSNPILEGVRDQILCKDTEVTRDLVLSGVTAYNGKIALDKDDILVIIDEIKEEEFRITYEVDLGANASVSKTATIKVDNQEPVISGATDRVLSPGQIPDLDYCRMGVLVTDNMSKLSSDDLIITIKQVSGEEWKAYLTNAIQEGASNPLQEPNVPIESENTVPQASGDKTEVGGSEEEKLTDMGYLVTYEIMDEAGNTTRITVVFHY